MNGVGEFYKMEKYNIENNLNQYFTVLNLSTNLTHTIFAKCMIDSFNVKLNNHGEI